MAIRTGPPTASLGIQKRSHIREYRLRRGPSKKLYPALGDGIRHRPITPGFLGGGRDMGPEESNPDRHAGAWRLLIWAPLLILAVASRFVLPSSWAGLVALWGWAPLLVGLAAVWAVVGFLGVREWKHHTDRLESIPIRIHVDGSRGKTGTCRLIGAALRANGLRVVVKTTGKLPVLIDVAGTERVLERPPTPTANLREQKEIVRLAREQNAQAIVIECMAVALGVCEFLGLDRERALEGMLHSTPDYGTVQLFERRNHAGVYTFVCALGVNDVDSLLELRRELIRRKKLDGGLLVGLFNSRDDRAPRSVEFARALTREIEFRSVVVTGRHTKAFVRSAVRHGYPRDQLCEMEDATPNELLDAIDARAPAGGAAFACGNMVTSVGYGLVEALVGRGSDGHAGS